MIGLELSIVEHYDVDPLFLACLLSASCSVDSSSASFTDVVMPLPRVVARVGLELLVVVHVGVTLSLFLILAFPLGIDFELGTCVPLSISFTFACNLSLLTPLFCIIVLLSYIFRVLSLEKLKSAVGVDSPVALD